MKVPSEITDVLPFLFRVKSSDDGRTVISLDEIRMLEASVVENIKGTSRTPAFVPKLPMNSIPGRTIMEPRDLGTQLVWTSAETRVLSRSVLAKAKREMRPLLKCCRGMWPRAI
jgi:hypothetical protein